MGPDLNWNAVCWCQEDRWPGGLPPECGGGPCCAGTEKDVYSLSFVNRGENIYAAVGIYIIYIYCVVCIYIWYRIYRGQVYGIYKEYKMRNLRIAYNVYMDVIIIHIKIMYNNWPYLTGPCSTRIVTQKINRILLSFYKSFSNPQ